MEVRYIEIKTGPAGQIIRAYTPEQYKKEMARRKNAAARARKLTRLQERVGAALAMLGFLMLPGAGRVGAQSLRGGAGRNNGGSADTGKDRHGLLPRLHIRESRNPLFAWAAAL